MPLFLHFSETIYKDRAKERPGMKTKIRGCVCGYVLVSAAFKIKKNGALNGTGKD